MRKHILLCITLFIPILGISQNKSLVKFEKTIYDFGTFSEDGDSPFYSFKFTNISNKPIVVLHVSSTCGCTAAEFSKQAITKGKEGYITVTYNPKGRPGAFSRSVNAYISGNDTPIKLTVKGKVTPGAIRKHTGYPYVIGDLQLKTDIVKFGIARGNRLVQKIVVINGGKDKLKLNFKSLSKDLTASMIPEVLSPDQTGEIKITKIINGNNNAKAECVQLKATSDLGKKKVIELISTPCH